MAEQKDGGPVFPQPLIETRDGAAVGPDHPGMKLRDYFAIHAPEATEAWLNQQGESDRLRNPHGDSYKPQRRSAMELRAAWRYQYADALISEREKGGA